MKIREIEALSARSGSWPFQTIRRLCLLATLLFLAAGCHRDEIKVYRVAKDSDQSQSPAAQPQSTDTPNPGLPPGHPDISNMPGTPAPSASGAGLPQLTWTTPAGWTVVPPSEMRVASFKVNGPNGKTVDVSVVPLPGLAGGDDANVNRWRGQVGQSPLAPDELQKSAEAVEVAGQSAQLYDIAGTNPGSGDAERIVGVIQHRDDMAWFFKMTGDANLAEQQKPAFIAFLKSVAFAAPQAPSEMPADHPAVGDMGATAPMMAAGSASASKPAWTVPAGWQEVPAAQFLLAEFAINGANGAKAEVNVAELSGDGGGLLANVNRWRGQLGLAPLSDDDLAKAVTALTVAGGQASLVDMTGTSPRTGQASRLVGVIVSQSGQTWFYKLMGDPAVVEGQKAAFTQFVSGVKY